MYRRYLSQQTNQAISQIIYKSFWLLVPHCADGVPKDLQGQTIHMFIKYIIFRKTLMPSLVNIKKYYQYIRHNL